MLLLQTVWVQEQALRVMSCYLPISVDFQSAFVDFLALSSVMSFPFAPRSFPHVSSPEGLRHLAIAALKSKKAISVASE